MKKIISILIVFLFIIMFFCLAKIYQNPFKKTDFKYANSIIIEILPPNEKVVISDNLQVAKIINYLESLRLKQEEPKNVSGLTYRIYINDENNYLCSIAGDQLIYKDKIYHISYSKVREFESNIKFNKNEK